MSGKSAVVLIAWRSSCVGGDPETGEDLPALRVVPVAEGRGRDAGPSGPGAAAQCTIVAAEEHLRVLPIGIGDEPGVALEPRRGPLPDVAHHPQAAVG